MSLDKWNSETTIKFIQQFKYHTCLWNRKTPTYKSKHAREAALQHLVEEMHIPDFGIREVLKKIKILRSTYYQERKKIQKSINAGGGSDTFYVPNIPWYNEMDGMLKNTNATLPITDTIKDSGDSPLHDSYFSNDADSGGDDNIDDTHEISRPTIKSEPKKRGLYRAIRDLKTLQGAINQELPGQVQREDQFDVFGTSVAMQLRALPFERGMIGQARIQNVLSELLIENFKYNNMANTTEAPMEHFKYDMTISAQPSMDRSSSAYNA